MQILDTESYPFIANTALLRGEQVFTSILFFEGKFLFIKEHLARLLKGADFLFPKHKWQDFESNIFTYVMNQSKKFEHKNYYCRLTIVDDYFFMIKSVHEISSQTIAITDALQMRTPSFRPSFLKLGQYADTFLELKNTNSDDVIFFDHQKFLTEASTSNLFVINSNGEITTPALSSMVLDGVTRMQMMKNLNVIEKNITKDDLLKSQEIWLANSIKGIRFVKQYEKIQFNQKNSIYEAVINKYGRYGEKICE